MIGFLGRLFDTTAFPPRWHCGVWAADHGWLHIHSDRAAFALALLRGLTLPGATRLVQEQTVPLTEANAERATIDQLFSSRKLQMIELE